MKDYGLFQTCNPKLVEILERSSQIAATPASILISGDSGTGKSTLVRFILEKSRYMQAPKIWNRSLSVDDIKNHEVIVIEDLAALSPDDQKVLSHLVDECRVDRQKYVRWIAVSSKDPNQLVQDQSLRRDLFYRFSVFHFIMPSLQQRAEDVEGLAKLFVQVSSILANQGQKELSRSAIEKLKSAPWYGNIRELEAVVERAVATSVGPVITENDLIWNSIKIEDRIAGQSQTLSEMERKLIFQTLDITQQNKTRAAQLLGISIRTLRNKLNEYKMQGVA